MKGPYHRYLSNKVKKMVKWGFTPELAYLRYTNYKLGLDNFLLWQSQKIEGRSEISFFISQNYNTFLPGGKKTKTKKKTGTKNKNESELPKRVQKIYARKEKPYMMAAKKAYGFSKSRIISRAYRTKILDTIITEEYGLDPSKIVEDARKTLKDSKYTPNRIKKILSHQTFRDLQWVANETVQAVNKKREKQNRQNQI